MHAFHHAHRSKLWACHRAENRALRKGTTVADQDKNDEPVAQTPADQQRQVRVEVTDKNCISLYANFCRVTGTPEELILDFGLNAQPFGVPTEPVEVKQRIVTNYFTAKRMLQALHMSVQRHEQAFGVLETDVQKRVIGNRSGGARPAQG
jgi:hypothetical protein